MIESFWHRVPDVILSKLHSQLEGLSSKEGKRRLKSYGFNRLEAQKRSSAYLLWSQFKSPLIFLLLFAAALSFFLSDKTDGIIISIIVLASGLLGFYQEKGAMEAVQKLIQIVAVKVRVLRDGTREEIPLEKVVPGDVVLFSAGDIIPGDCLLLESKDFFVDEATLTGETYAVEKKEGTLPLATPLAKRTNVLFMGSHAVSGTAKAVVVRTGKKTEFGHISEHLKLHPPETAFEHGVRRFGYMLIELTLVLVLGIFAINIFLNRPFLESFLFALALAVGLTPQLLPAIITVNLAKGAKEMAKHKVIVKRLASIENFGSMNILCCDKTGTLTEGVVELHAGLGINGEKNSKVQQFAFLNAHFQTGYTNPIDQAITTHCPFDSDGWRKLDEIPYDFLRKRVSVLVVEKEPLMIVKGAFAPVFSICTHVETALGTIEDIASHRAQIEKLFESRSQEGYRLIAVAYKKTQAQAIVKEDEKELIFLGFIVLVDPVKKRVTETIAELKKLGIGLKIITGDNQFVTAHMAQEIGIGPGRIITGALLRKIGDAALVKKVTEIDLFAEIEPNQKERIILALRKAGHVVGFMGDGINDATALHTADVGISVETAADAAKEVADIVLLRKDLSVLVRGVQEGRKTFVNTMKYVFMAVSANFGNMFSMAGISLFLNFLPLLPKQILLMNLLTDFPEMTIATDGIDKELVIGPVKWDLKFIRRFMVVFGLVSSIFDYLTFGVLIFFLHASPEQFRTGWFLESVVSASVIVLVVRTRRLFFRSRPSWLLALAVGAIVAVTLFLPYTPLAILFNFQPLPLSFYGIIGGIVALYILSVEIAKRWFFSLR